MTNDEIEKEVMEPYELLEERLTEFGKYKRDGQCLFEKDWLDLKKWMLSTAFTFAKKIRKDTIEECAKVAEEADNEEAKGNTYFAQLGDSSATKYAIAKTIRALEVES